MEKKDLGNLLLIEGAVIFISSTLFWVIASRIFEIYTYMFHLGLIVLPSNLTLCFIIAGLIVKEKKGKNDIISERKYLVCSIVYMIFGIYIFMLIALIDSPIGPPILGPSNMNVDWRGLEVIFLVFVPELVLIFSSIELLVKKSRRWLVIGGLMLIISMGSLQYWLGLIRMTYEYVI